MFWITTVTIYWTTTKLIILRLFSEHFFFFVRGILKVLWKILSPWNMNKWILSDEIHWTVQFSRSRFKSFLRNLFVSVFLNYSVRYCREIPNMTFSKYQLDTIFYQKQHTVIMIGRHSFRSKYCTQKNK